jgi:hypothetical protein
MGIDGRVCFNFDNFLLPLLESTQRAQGSSNKEIGSTTEACHNLTDPVPEL